MFRPSLFLLSSIVFLSLSAAAQDPAALLRRADRVKQAWPEVVLSLRVTTTKPGDTRRKRPKKDLLRR